MKIRPAILALIAAALVVTGCALKQNPGESDEDFEARQEAAREAAAQTAAGVGEVAATVLPPPWNVITAAAAAAAAGYYLRRRRDPATGAPKP